MPAVLFIGVAQVEVDKWTALHRKLGIHKPHLAALAPIILQDSRLTMDNLVVVGTDVLVQEDVRDIFAAAPTSTRAAAHAAFEDTDRPSEMLPAALLLDGTRHSGTFLFHPTFYRANLSVLRQSAAVALEKLYDIVQNRFDRDGMAGAPNDFLLQTALHGSWGTIQHGERFLHGLGYRKGIGATELSAASALSWDGKRKPWLAEGLYVDYWVQHRQECNPVEGV